MKNYRSRNFTLSEVIHSDFNSFPKDLLPIAFHVLGFLQCLRDATGLILVPTSGYRSSGFNATLKGASPNSHHIWRFEGDRLTWAVDLKSPDVSPEELFNRLKPLVHGETYLHRALGFVHISAQAKDEEWVV